MVVVWSGALAGLPGYSKFRFFQALSGAQANSAAANLSTFLNAVKTNLPSIVTLTFPTTCTTHDDDGTLTGEVAISTVPAPIVGGSVTAISVASGFMVRWLTGAINGGHKVEGRTYFVPVGIGVFQTDGTITDSQRTSMLSAARTYAFSIPSPAVNSRARAGNPTAVNATYAVVDALLPDKQVVLRSRRD